MSDSADFATVHTSAGAPSAVTTTVSASSSAYRAPAFNGKVLEADDIMIHDPLWQVSCLVVHYSTDGQRIRRLRYWLPQHKMHKLACKRSVRLWFSETQEQV
jgi:hypothetical protein